MIQIVKGVILTEEALALIKGREDELLPQDTMEPYMTQLGVLEDEGLRKLLLVLSAEKKRLRAEVEEVQRRAKDGLTVKEAKEMATRYGNEATKVSEMNDLFWTLVRDSLPADCNILEYGGIGIAEGWAIYGTNKTAFSEILSQVFGGQVEIIRI